MTVSNPATLSSVRAEFGGPGNLAAYVRGGAYVPSNASATIATTAGALRLSQFNGVSKPSAGLTLALSRYSMAGASASKGTFAIGSTTATASGGTGNYTYSIITVQDAFGDNSNIQMTWSSPTATFRGVNIQAGAGNCEGVWQITVNDGVSTASQQVVVDWN